MYDVIIAGAGASGCFCAITAAKRGKSVLVLEKEDKPLKKLLATGNGKCNFTNEAMDVSHYSGNRTLIDTVLSQYGRDDALSAFREMGIYPKNKNGYYYPASEQAASVAHVLTRRLKQLSVTVLCGEAVQGIEKKQKGFVVKTGQKTYEGASLVLACGLKAAPQLGSDGSLFGQIKELGHRFVPIVPALCGFYCSGADFKALSGVRVGATVQAVIDGKTAAADTGELQLTGYGCSGIPIFQISRHLSLALYEKRNVQIALSFLPELSCAQLKEELTCRMQRMGFSQIKDRRETEELLCGLLPEKLIKETAMQLNREKGFYGLQGLKQTERLLDMIKARTVTVEAWRDYAYAQVCAGGVRTEEIQASTLESAIVPGLFFAGELLDADGVCGGYNLQWAWSSGYVAGSCAGT